MRKWKGFTLVELLVVIGILAVLISLLLPAISKVRQSAMRTVCAGRLRDLTTASLLYQDEFRKLPEPPTYPIAAAPLPLPNPVNSLVPKIVIPHQIPTRLLNDLQRYLKYPLIEPGVPTTKLPPAVQCPFIEDTDDQRGPYPAPGGSGEFYLTGYQYVARLNEYSNVVDQVLNTVPLPGNNIPNTLLKPNRAARATAQKRAVIWSDNLHVTLVPVVTFSYGHKRGNSPKGPLPLTLIDAKAFDGQHRAYSDGSIEWVPASGFQLDSITSELLDANASYRTNGTTYWWF